MELDKKNDLFSSRITIQKAGIKQETTVKFNYWRPS